MPRVVRRAKQRRAKLTDAHIQQLLSGFDLIGTAFGDDRSKPCDRDAMREAWEALRDELLQEWIAEKPGSRPWAWWTFDAPERRRRIGTWRVRDGAAKDPITRQFADTDYELVEDGKPHPFDIPERQAYVRDWAAEYPEPASTANRLTFGKPSAHVGYQVDGQLSWDDFDAAYETEAMFLKRLDLFTAEELAILTAEENSV